MKNILPQPFFERSAVDVALDLLGAYLVHNTPFGIQRYMITETEGYEGYEDKASHAHKGLTKRTRVMFGPAGYWYVYLVYGMYDMLNIVTGVDGHPGAVLIRGVEGLDGPGKLTRALGITRRYNELPATGESGLWIEKDVAHNVPYTQTPRIGVEYAGEWADKPWRFVMS